VKAIVYLDSAHCVHGFRNGISSMLEKQIISYVHAGERVLKWLMSKKVFVVKVCISSMFYKDHKELVLRFLEHNSQAHHI